MDTMPTTSTDLLTRFEEHVRKNDLFRKGDLLFLAVSGGLDSVVLTDLVHSMGMSFVILHVNFQLRGAESDRDQAFVEALGSKHKAIVMSNRVETARYAEEHRMSIQEAARELRYDWFRGFLAPGPADKGRKFVLTAHHADDDVETLLQHFFQGSGIAGLHGIPERLNGVVRPLLFARRSELEVYAKDRGLEWVEDSSNATVKYTRNAIRHELLPAIERVFPKVRENLADNLGRFREIEMLYREGLSRHLKRLLQETDGGWKIPVEALRHARPLRTLTWEIFSRFGFTTGQIGGVIDLLDSDTGRYLDSSTHRILRDRKWLLVSALQEPVTGTVVIEKGSGEVAIPGGYLHISMEEKPGMVDLPPDAHIACLDEKHVRFPLLVRKWKAGDYFYPLGMRKKQKVARYLINAKVDRLAKERVLVVESDRRIIWVMGHRVDDRFKVTEATRQRLVLQVLP